MSFFEKKMESFSLSSNLFNNLTSVANSVYPYKDHCFTIVVNQTTKIEVPAIVAASISSKIAQILKLDPTAEEIKVNIQKKYDIRSILEKIKKCIVFGQTVQLESIEEMDVFANFGREIGNSDFFEPMKRKMKNFSENLSEENVLYSLTTKNALEINDTKKETDFIAENFESMKNKEEFKNYAMSLDNIKVVEEIISSNKIKLDNEDSLLLFAIDVSKSNNCYPSTFCLFDHVLLQYCSVSSCTKYIDFVNSLIPSPEFGSLISCFSKRITETNIPLNPPFIEGRHNPIIDEIRKEDSLEGIFFKEKLKENVELKYSSLCFSKIEDILDLEKNNDIEIYKGSFSNPFASASLKDGKTFIIKSYMLKANSGSHRIKNWKLEGLKSENDEWILIDKHENQPFNESEVKTFDVSCKWPLKEVKLSHFGNNTGGSNNLHINNFDIFGIINT